MLQPIEIINLIANSIIITILTIMLGSSGIGGLLNSMFNIKPAAKQKTVDLCVLGLDNAGKTTILKALSNEEIQYVMPTQGFNIKSLTQGNFKFNAWDLGGQKAIRKHWKNFYSQIDCIVSIFCSTSHYQYLQFVMIRYS
jgi:GTPase SAR1 family protein